jgi:integrase/recombinase XerD
MKVSKAAKIWIDYHRTHSKKNTVRAYESLISKFCKELGDYEIRHLTVDAVLTFLDHLTEGCKPQTKRVRFARLCSFFNFIKTNINADFTNPCDSPMLRKLFRPAVTVNWDIVEKETVDEIIFITAKIRNRIMLELMARGGMRIGEVIKLRPKDIQDSKLVINGPKNGKEYEYVFIPKKVAERLRQYTRQVCQTPDERIFPISYEAARIAVRKAGNLVNIALKPHDLRRHAATYASRSGAPLEIVSKILLRHSNLATTQRYWGKSAIRKQ